MLRIRCWDEEGKWVVRVEGRLADPWVDELRRVLASLDTRPDGVSLELGELGYVDASGARLLREQVAAGARIRSQSPFVAALTSGGDESLVEAALAGDEAAFVALVRRHQPSMLRVALCYVRTEASAEEVAQEAWMAIFRGLSPWEGRGSFRAWILSIVANQARARSVREARSVPYSSLSDEDDGTSALREGPPSDPAGRDGRGSAAPGTRWPDPVESRETLEVIRSAIDALPPSQRAVILFRDVSGCEAHETCEALHVSAANQRVLLHRARLKVRAAVDSYLAAQ